MSVLVKKGDRDTHKKKETPGMRTHREKATWREKVVICKPRTEAFRETKSVVWMKKNRFYGQSPHRAFRS